MKALKLISPGKLKVFNNIQVPKISDESILIKIKYCGICSSDIKFIDTGHRIKRYPVTLGHEISGLVYKIGKNVKKYNIGDHVVIGAEIPCGKKRKCSYCAQNKSLYCENYKSLGTSINGGFAEYIKINKDFINNGPIIKIPKSINFQASCLSESIACVINGIENVDLNKINSVLIIGSGYIGILFTLILNKSYKLKNIFVIDSNSKRLKIAKDFGAKKTIKIILNEKIKHSEIFKSNKKQKFDFVISANNNIHSHRVAPYLVRKGGYVNLFGGIPKGENDKLILSSNYIHYNQINISGSFSSDIHHLKKAVKFISNNQKIFGKLISNVINIENLIEYLKLVKYNKVLKVLVKL